MDVYPPIEITMSIDKNCENHIRLPSINQSADSIGEVFRNIKSTGIT